jgi:hypothetical protein
MRETCGNSTVICYRGNCTYRNRYMVPDHMSSAIVLTIQIVNTRQTSNYLVFRLLCTNEINMINISVRDIH